MSLLDKVDDLQVIGKPNSWVYPDARLNMTRTNDESGRKVDSVTVQLNSATFSFQVISARLGWPLRIYPKNAKPRFGMHASEDGVLKKDLPGGVECAASDGSVRKGAGHGHNFHIVENTGDLVTIYVAREMKPQYDEYADTKKSSMNEAQLEQVFYQVWYELVETARPANKTEEEDRSLLDSSRKVCLTNFPFIIIIFFFFFFFFSISLSPPSFLSSLLLNFILFHIYIFLLFLPYPLSFITNIYILTVCPCKR